MTQHNENMIKILIAKSERALKDAQDNFGYGSA